MRELKTKYKNEYVASLQQIREISIDGCEIIGRGGNGAVYRISEDSIVKLYYANVDMEQIEEEKRYARTAFVLGIPTAISFHIVSCDGRLGIIYELINCDTLAQSMNRYPDELIRSTELMAALAKQLHRIENKDGVFRSVKKEYRDYVLRAEYLSPEEKAKCLALIDNTPDRNTLIHGDIHTRNIMVDDSEPLFIDMADMGYGHPVFDLGAMYLTFVISGYTTDLIGIDKETALKVWDIFLKMYFNTEDEERLTELKKIIKVYGCLKFIIAPVKSPVITQELKDRVVAAARAALFPIIDDATGKVNF